MRTSIKRVFHYISFRIQIFFELCFIIICLPLILIIGSLYICADTLTIKLNKKYIRKKIKPLINEYYLIYGQDLEKDEYFSCNINEKEIFIYATTTFLFFNTKANIRDLDYGIDEFKKNHGCLDVESFKTNISHYTSISNLKKEKGNIFFSTILNCEKALRDVHLYDLSNLNSHEIESLLSLPIAPQQKAIIYKKLNLK